MRKIKLMALLLAALMIVTAFAGCAGVKKEELDALDVRVQALEDLLNGQQKDLADIKSEIAGLDNKEVLDAIESIKTDLESQIKDVNTRVDEEIDKADTAAPAEVSAETKAEQQKALALIEVKRAEFSKASDEYSEEDYVKISEALGTATGAVGAATTVDAVKAAMTALDAELAKYMTYAMKAYDYYCKLLGNVNADAGDLVEEVKAFIKEVDAVYEGQTVKFTGRLYSETIAAPQYTSYNDVAVNSWIGELAYLVAEGSSEVKDEYIDIYTAIKNLCYLYTTKTGTKNIAYVDDEGDIVVTTLKTVKQYTVEAEDLVKEIDSKLGENFVYGTAEYTGFSTLYNKYETYVDAASLLGGEKLANLITNANAIVEAEDAFKLIEEAFEAFDKATRVKAGDYKNVFYYYENLTNPALLETTRKDTGKTVWTADELEKVADILADWIAEYELSEDNVLAILAAKKTAGKIAFDYTSTSGARDTYVYNTHLNALLVEAVNSFKTIADKILDINEIEQISADAVLAYDDVENLYSDFIKLQEATSDKTVKYPANLAITLDDVNFKVIVRESDLFAKYADLRLDEAFKGTPSFGGVNGLIDLYTFAGDVDELGNTYFADTNNNNVIDSGEDNRSTGKIYDFFMNTYSNMKSDAKLINNEIKALAKAVAENQLADNHWFIDLKADYIKIPDKIGGVAVTLTINGATFTSANDVYVAVGKVYDTSTKLENYLNTYPTTKSYTDWVKNGSTSTATVLTIPAFNAKYPEFAAMINVADLDKAAADMEARMDTLFADAADILDLVEAIDYVRTGSTSFTYVDDNGNGKYDKDNTNERASLKALTTAPARLVALSDKANVNAAYAKYDAWTKAGGHVNMQRFDNYVDATGEEFAEVFEMAKVEDYKKIDEATKLIRKLAAQIEDLEVLAYHFTQAVVNVKAVDAATAITVNLERNDLNKTANNQRFYAFTKYTKSTHDNALDNDGTYVLVKYDTPWETETYYTSVSDTSTGNVDLESWFTGNKVADKENLLTKTAAAYRAFYAANVKYVADIANDYTDTKNDYYQVAEYEEYAAVKTALADFAKYDLLSVKGYLLKTIATKTGEADAWKYLKAQVAGAASVGEVENYLYAFADEYNSIAITATQVGAYSVNEFARLATLAK